MIITANAIMTLLFSSPYLCFWGVIVVPGAYALIHRIISVQTRV